MNKEKSMRKAVRANQDEQVVKGFGEEWSRFPQEELTESEREMIFKDYFSVFPWADLPANACGADIGCGSGRWATVVADRVAQLCCVDASSEALEVAKKNLAGRANVTFMKADVGNLPFVDGELDFAYSLGVLHHVPDPQKAIANVARALKSGAPFLVYLYYSFENRPLWFRMLWWLSNGLRWMICRMPSSPRFTVCDAIAVFICWPLAKIAALLNLLNLPFKNLPLAYYRDKSFYTMRTDMLDRFGTRLEKRFHREQITAMLDAAGFGDTRFGTGEPFWCAVARKR